MAETPRATAIAATYALVSRPKGGVLYADLGFTKASGGLKKTVLMHSTVGATGSGTDRCTINYVRGTMWNRVSPSDVSVITQKVGNAIIHFDARFASGIPNNVRLAVFDEAIALLQERRQNIVDGVIEGGSFVVPNGTIQP